MGARKAGPGNAKRSSRGNKENHPPEREAKIKPFGAEGLGVLAFRVRKTATHRKHLGLPGGEYSPVCWEYGVLRAAPSSHCTRPAHTCPAPGPCPETHVCAPEGRHESEQRSPDRGREHPPTPGPRAERSCGPPASGRAWLRETECPQPGGPDSFHSHSRHCTRAVWMMHT